MTTEAECLDAAGEAPHDYISVEASAGAPLANLTVAGRVCSRWRRTSGKQTATAVDAEQLREWMLAQEPRNEPRLHVRAIGRASTANH